MRSSIGCIQNDFWAYGTFTANRAPSCVKISTISKWTKASFSVEPCHLGVPSGVSRTISELMVHLAQTVHLSCTDTNTVSKRTETRLHRTTSPWSSIGCVQNDFWAYGTFIANYAPILHQDKQYLQMDQNKLPVEPCHQGVPSGASKMISDPMVCSAQTLHLSCGKISTISKQTKTSFHLTLVT
jgi:hypothetical protein